VARHGKDGVVSESQDDRTAEASADQPVFDTSAANPARIWNYWLGGKDHFEADREAAEKVIEVMPSMPLLARLARRQLIDTVRLLVDVRYPAIPGHRERPAHGRQHPRGRAARRPAGADRLRGQ